jgi:hypothetical protein
MVCQQEQRGIGKYRNTGVILLMHLIFPNKSQLCLDVFEVYPEKNMLFLSVRCIAIGVLLLLCLPFVKASVGDNASIIVNPEIPATMVSGHSYRISLTLRNTGTTIWLSSADAPQGAYCLSEGTTPSGLWGLTQVQLPRSVSPGELQEFNFSINAPTIPGNYHFQWRMYRGTIGFFGDATLNLVVTVTSTPVTHLNAVSAIQLAVAFCQKVGSPIIVPGAADYVNLLTSASLDYWQSYWIVNFPGQAEIKIADATGVIVEYSDTRLGGASGSTLPVAGTAISQANALQYASAALQATGQTDDLLPTPYITEDQLSDPPLSITHYWSISWQRRFQGIPYRGQSANVMLRAETGQLFGLSLVYPSPPPTSGSTTVSQVQAQAIAATFLVGKSVPTVTFNSSQLEIVQPNTFWQNGNDDAQPNVANVAWTNLFDVSSSSQGAQYSVWVDAQSGSVVGGDYFGGSLGAKITYKLSKISHIHAGHQKAAIHQKSKLTKPKNKAAKDKPFSSLPHS